MQPLKVIQWFSGSVVYIRVKHQRVVDANVKQRVGLTLTHRTQVRSICQRLRFLRYAEKIQCSCNDF